MFALENFLIRALKKKLLFNKEQQPGQSNSFGLAKYISIFIPKYLA